MEPRAGSLDPWDGEIVYYKEEKSSHCTWTVFHTLTQKGGIYNLTCFKGAVEELLLYWGVVMLPMFISHSVIQTAMRA